SESGGAATAGSGGAPAILRTPGVADRGGFQPEAGERLPVWVVHGEIAMRRPGRLGPAPFAMARAGVQPTGGSRVAPLPGWPDCAGVVGSILQWRGRWASGAPAMVGAPLRPAIRTPDGRV